MKKIGLVTVLYKSDDVLGEFYESLALQKYDNYILYIIDNSFTPATEALVKSLNEKHGIQQVQYVANASNIGVAAANNAGIRLALHDGCEGVILLNNDIYFNDPDLFGSLVQYGTSHPEAILAPKVYFAGTNKLWYAGGYFTLWRGGTNHIGYMKEDNGQYNNTTSVDYAPTCFVYISSEVFAKVGLMDERYFVYVDDADFVFRALQLGYRVMYLPQLQIQHKVSLSTGGVYSDFGAFYNTRNRIFWARKSIKGLTKYSAFLYIYWNMMFYSLRENGFNSIKKVNKAMIAGFKMKL